MSAERSRRYFSVLLLASCGACGSREPAAEELGSVRQGTIYGRDDRVDARSFPDPALRELAETVVGALIPAEDLSPQEKGDYRLEGQTLAERVPLCATEPLLDEPSLAHCTATLAEGNTILTAGHCVPPERLRDLRFVRGYALGDPYPIVTESQVQALDRLLLVRNGDIATDSGDDLAVVRLVSNIELPHVTFTDPDTPPAKGDPVVVIGTSESLPLKIDAGGAVFDDTPNEYFEATTDTFAGGSGSPVFTPAGGYLGMIVGGGTDYAWNDDDTCLERVHLDMPATRAEVVVRASIIEAALSEALAMRPLPAEGAKSEPPADDHGCSIAKVPESLRGRSPAGAWLVVLSAGAWTYRRRGQSGAS